MTVDRSDPDVVQLVHAMGALVAAHVKLVLATIDVAGARESRADAIVEDYLAAWIRGAGAGALVMTAIAPLVRRGARDALAMRRKIKADTVVAETLATMGTPLGNGSIQ